MGIMRGDEYFCLSFEQIVHVLRMDRKMCFCRLGNNIYRQRTGIPMGSPPSPPQARIVCAYAERQFEQLAVDPGRVFNCAKYRLALRGILVRPLAQSPSSTLGGPTAHLARIGLSRSGSAQQPGPVLGRAVASAQRRRPAQVPRDPVARQVHGHPFSLIWDVLSQVVINTVPVAGATPASGFPPSTNCTHTPVRQRAESSRSPELLRAPTGRRSSMSPQYLSCFHLTSTAAACLVSASPSNEYSLFDVGTPMRVRVRPSTDSTRTPSPSKITLWN